jgi:hypothetical protein
MRGVGRIVWLIKVLKLIIVDTVEGGHIRTHAVMKELIWLSLNDGICPVAPIGDGCVGITRDCGARIHNGVCLNLKYRTVR